MGYCNFKSGFSDDSVIAICNGVRVIQKRIPSGPQGTSYGEFFLASDGYNEFILELPEDGIRDEVSFVASPAAIPEIGANYDRLHREITFDFIYRAPRED